MSTAWWIVFALYSLYPIRLTMRQFYHDFWFGVDEKPTWLGVIAILVVGLLMGPFMGTFLMVYELSKWFAGREVSLERSDRAARLLAGESRESKRERLRLERKSRENRIRELERELELERAE